MSIRKETIETVNGPVKVEYTLWRGSPTTQYRACVNGPFVLPVVYRKGSMRELYRLVHSKARKLNFQQNHYDGWRAVEYLLANNEARRKGKQQ